MDIKTGDTDFFDTFPLLFPFPPASALGAAARAAQKAIRLGHVSHAAAHARGACRVLGSYPYIHAVRYFTASHRLGYRPGICHVWLNHERT